MFEHLGSAEGKEGLGKEAGSALCAHSPSAGEDRVPRAMLLTGLLNLGSWLDLRDPLNTESSIRCVLYFLGELVQNLHHVQKGVHKLKNVKPLI